MSFHTGIEPNKESDVSELNLPTKKYVDDKLNLKVDKAGDTITGPLSMDDGKIWDLASGTLDTNAVNKKYIDDQDATLQTRINLKLSKCGDSMSGELDMGTNKITDLATPTNNTDASNKKYVDDQDALKMSDVVVLDNSFTTGATGYVSTSSGSTHCVQHNVLSTDIDTVVRKHLHITYNGPAGGFSLAGSLGGKQIIVFGGFKQISGRVAFANIKVRIRGHLTNALRRTLSDGLHRLDTAYDLHFENMTYLLVRFEGPNTRRTIDFDLIIDLDIEI